MGFYCKKVCFDDSFSIEEWNEADKELDLTNLSEKEKLNILLPKACKKQCDDCINTVLDTRERRQF